MHPNLCSTKPKVILGTVTVPPTETETSLPRYVRDRSQTPGLYPSPAATVQGSESLFQG